jgi:parallel beta-helix repeat protein
MIIGMLLVTPMLYAGTIYVGDGETYTTIKSAVDVAGSGDVVIVRDGTYNEIVEIDKPLTLKSENGYTKTTIALNSDYYKFIYILSDSVIIDGFTINGAYKTNAIYCSRNHCIIRNNRFGLDETHYNQTGIKLYSSSHLIITNNLFQSNTENSIILENSNLCTIASNTFIGSKYGINMNDSNNNYIYQNSFINHLQATIKSDRNSMSDFQSPFEMTYSWNGSMNKSYLGNYYSDFPSTIKDLDGNGIIDSYYPMPYIIPNDDFPLISKATAYEKRIYFLQSNNILSKKIDHTFPAYVWIKNDNSVMWVSNEPFEKSTTFSGEDHWGVNMKFGSFYDEGYIVDEGEIYLNIKIGYSKTGTDFTMILQKTLRLNVNNINKHYFNLDKQSLSIQPGHYLAFKIINYSDIDCTIHTPQTYISPPLSYIRPPVIYEISPNNGSVEGDTLIAIEGLNFGDQVGQVFFDDKPVALIEKWMNSQILCKTPKHNKGFSTIQVVGNNQLSSTTHKKYYFHEGSLCVGPENNFQSIQQAVKFANEGDSITVFPGMYHENIHINKPIHLQSQSGANSTTIVGEEEIVYISGSQTTMQGFTIYGSYTSSTGVFVDTDNCTITENCFGVSLEKRNNIGINGYVSKYINITHNHFSKNFMGIKLSSNHVNIIDNTFFSNSDGINSIISNCAIADNTFISNTNGVYLKNASYNTVAENKFISNTVGINIQDDGQNYRSSDIIFCNSFIDNNIPVVSNNISPNIWQSPVPFYYTYNGKSFVNYLGNYYSNNNFLDINADGIIDRYYKTTMIDPVDNYPLLYPSEQYSPNLFYFNSNYQVNSFDSFDQSQQAKMHGGYIYLSGNQTKDWILKTNEWLKTILSEQSIIYGKIVLTKIPKTGEMFTIEIGLIDDENVFEQTGSSNIYANGITNKLTYQMDCNPITIQPDENVAIRATNNNNDTYTVGTRLLSSGFSIFPDFKKTRAFNVYPDQGPISGGSTVLISGLNLGELQGETQILFGNTPVSVYTSWSNTSIVCQAPAHEKGWVNLSIKHDGFIQKMNKVKYLYKEKTLYVGESQMFSEIQQAINHAQPFDTVLVQSGEYEENITIVKPIVLQSESGYSSTTIISKQTGPTIEMNYENSIIDGFTIIGEVAIDAKKDSSIIRNNRCGTSKDHNNNGGIILGSHKNIVEKNIISANNDYGIFVNGWYNYISNNFCFDNGKGIVVSGKYNNIASNKCNNNRESGIITTQYNEYNSILYNHCLKNYNGITIGSDRNIVYANQCIYNTYSGIYIEDKYCRNNLFSNNICKSNELSGIYVRSGDNTFYFNQLQNPNSIDVIVKKRTNRWYSPMPFTYTYNDTQFFCSVGNFYESHYSVDVNNDGIYEDSFYVISDYSKGDLYPLAATIDNYQADILILQPDDKISKNDTVIAENISITPGESVLWQTFEKTVSEIDFTQSHQLSGQLSTSLGTNRHIILSIGYLDTNDSFISISNPVNLTGVSNEKVYYFQTTTRAIPSNLNGPLVIKIENPNAYNVEILTGSRWSFISIGEISDTTPVPENDNYIVNSGSTLSIEPPGVLQNDFNPEDTPLTSILKTPTKSGTLTLNPDGSFQYVHNGSSVTSDHFTYKINNGYEDSIKDAQVSIQILQPPMITLSPNQNVTRENISITINGNAGTIEYRLNNLEWQSYSQPFLVTDEGIHEITARLQTQNPEWIVSQPISFVIDRTPPEPPQLNSTYPQTGTQTSVDSIKVSWLTANDLFSDIIGYSYTLDNKAESLPDDIIDTQMLSFTSPSLEWGKSYYFHIRAIDSANNVSVALHVGPFIIMKDHNPPPPPTNLKVVKQIDATVKLEWDYINGYDGTSYQVYRSELPDGRYYRVDTGEHGFYSINNQKVYYTDHQLINGQSYFYKVTSFWNHLRSDYSNTVSAIPKQSFEFSCNTIDFDSQATWRVSKKVNVQGDTQYHFLIKGGDKFKGEIEASCNGLPDHVYYSFSLSNIDYGPSIHGITLPAAFVLSITAGSAAIPGEYQFDLYLKNVWENASSDFMEIPLMLTIQKEISAGIIMDISKQPEASLFETRKRDHEDDNEIIRINRNLSTETIKYRIHKNEPVEIYGEIFPAHKNRPITLLLECNNSDFKASTIIQTDSDGKFNQENWLSTFDLNEYTLTASWSSGMSTTHVSNPRIIIIEKGKPYLTCNSESNITPQLNHDFTISGSIDPPKPGSHVYLSVISPEKEMYQHDLVLNDNGEFEKTDSFFNRRGIWKIKAYWFGDDTHIGCESPFLIVPVDTSAGRGIILGGGKASTHNSEFDLVKRLTTEAYKDFRSRGFTDEMIYYAINSQIIDITDNEVPDNIVDNTLPSADSFLSAIENEFANEVNEEIPLFIYMYGHGTNDGRFVVLGYDEVIEANQLDQSLTNIQKKTDCVVILIIESCYSGSFIKDVSGENRIILTSTDNKPYIHDSSGNITFSRYLFNHLLRNYSIKYSFDKAKEDLTNISYDPPLLDDNGDGISDQSDGALASNYYFKGSITWNFNVTIDENSIQMPYLVSNEKPVNVSAKVIRGDTATEAVWASIIPPDADLTGSDDLVTFQKIFLSYNSETQRYEGQLRYLCDAGLYKLVFMARQTNDAMSNPVVKYLTVEQSAAPKDIDGNGAVDLGDTILGLQVLSDFDVMMCRQPELSFGLDDLLILFQSIAD